LIEEIGRAKEVRGRRQEGGRRGGKKMWKVEKKMRGHERTVGKESE